jgi:hypothetical protein
MKNQNSVVLSNKKNRKYIKLYEPLDKLEIYMLENNDKKLSLDFPTHISQKGNIIIHIRWILPHKFNKKSKFF